MANFIDRYTYRVTWSEEDNEYVGYRKQTELNTVKSQLKKAPFQTPSSCLNH